MLPVEAPNYIYMFAVGNCSALIPFTRERTYDGAFGLETTGETVAVGFLGLPLTSCPLNAAPLWPWPWPWPWPCP